ncbi:MAG: ribose-5-phosphate isomerase RpiA [Gemmatimonadaceae bacterium]
MSERRTQLKAAAGAFAAEFVQSGMVVGLGTGSTAFFATQQIAARLARGELANVVGIPTSAATEHLAQGLSIPLVTTGWPTEIDITIDGADEVDPVLHLIKGGGGALLREKIVAQASRRVMIVCDDAKLVGVLGSRAPLPVEVVSFGWEGQMRFLGTLGATVSRRVGPGGNPVTTDLGHYLLDCTFASIENPSELASQLSARAGIVEHGLFLGLATDLVVGTKRGIEHRSRPGTAV